MDRVCMKPNACLNPNRGQGKPALRFIFPLAVIIAMAGTAHADIHIGGWSLWANGQLARDFQYTGSCPVDLKFDWGVVSTEPVTATSSFLRSDGGHSSTSPSFDLPGGGRSLPITEEWRLGANTPQFQNYSGWIELTVESADHKISVSKKINFTIHCAAEAAGLRIGGWSFWANGKLARDFQYTGACPVNLKFDWGVVSAAPVTATYSFLRNDGGHSSTSKSIALPGGGRSTPILEEWRLGANTPKFQPYKGWVELDIESPEHVSKRIPFTIQCQ